MKILIVEDELMAQKSLTRVLMQNFPDMEIVGCTTSVKGTVEWLKNPANHADIIFMDVELSDGVCFEIFRQIEVKAKASAGNDGKIYGSITNRFNNECITRLQRTNLVFKL